MRTAGPEDGPTVSAPAGPVDELGNHRYQPDEDFCAVCGMSRAFLDERRIVCPGVAVDKHGPDVRRALRHEHPLGWAHFDYGELVESGLLQLLNRSVLWPLGIALTVSVNRDADTGEADWDGAYLCMLSTDPPEVITSAGMDRTSSYAAWLARRTREVRA